MENETCAPSDPIRKGRPRRKEKKVRTAEDLRQVKRTLGSALSRRVRASSSSCFEACTLASMKRIAVPGYGTMAVTYIGFRPVLVFDPEAVAWYSEPELDLTLKHEVLHLTLYHLVRGALIRQRYDSPTIDKEERKLHVLADGLAADYPINEMLMREYPQMRDPEGELGYWALPEHIGLPRGLTYEAYFPLVLEFLRKKRDEERKRREELEKLKQEQKQTSEQEPQDDGGEDASQQTQSLFDEDATPGDGPAQPSEEDGDDAGEGEDGGDSKGSVFAAPTGDAPGDASGEETPSAPKKLGRPKNLDQLLEAVERLLEIVDTEEAAHAEAAKDMALLGAGSQLDKMPTEAELAAATEAAVRQAEVTVSSYGKSIPGQYQKTKVKPPEERLEGTEGLFEAMRTITATSMSKGSGTSMSSINRQAAARAHFHRQQGGAHAAFAQRIPLVPGIGYGVTLCAVIVLDTSGSMTDQMLSYAIGVVRDMLEEFGITEGALLECDDRTTRVLHLEPGAALPEDVVGRGGTNFDPGLLGATEWAKEQGVDLDVIIYITDGDAYRPHVRVDVPTIWAGVGLCKPVLADVPGNINVALRRDF